MCIFPSVPSNSTFSRRNVPTTFSVEASTVILSTPTVVVASDVTGTLNTLSESTSPNSWFSVTAVLVVPLATTHFPLTALRFVIVPSGITIFALVAPLEILTGTDFEYVSIF